MQQQKSGVAVWTRINAYQSAGARKGFKVRGGAKLHELGNQKFCQRFIKSGNQARATGFYDTRQLWGN